MNFKCFRDSRTNIWFFSYFLNCTILQYESLSFSNMRLECILKISKIYHSWNDFVKNHSTLLIHWFWIFFRLDYQINRIFCNCYNFRYDFVHGSLNYFEIIIIFSVMMIRYWNIIRAYGKHMFINWINIENMLSTNFLRNWNVYLITFLCE